MDLTFTQQLQQFAANHTIMVVAWVALLLAVLFNFYKGATNKFKVIDNLQATNLINKEEGVFLDLRSDDEFKAGHIVDAHHIFPTDIKTQKIQTIEKFKQQPVILVDTNGLTASSVANTLSSQGFEKVFVLKDGMAGWRGANLPTVKKHK